MRHIRKLFVSLLPVLFFTSTALISERAIALDPKAWEASINHQSKERYIPVELWAGADWDGNNELKMRPVDSTYRHPKATYQIKGPMEWEHPTMGVKFLVYERINPGRDGVKLQLLPSTRSKTALAGFMTAGLVAAVRSDAGRF